MTKEITLKEVERMAELAKLEFTPEEKEAMRNDLSRIVAFVEKLNEIDTNGIEPLIYLVDEPANLRTDEVHQPITQQEALLNAPKKDSDFIKVPRVVNK